MWHCMIVLYCTLYIELKIVKFCVAQRTARSCSYAYAECCVTVFPFRCVPAWMTAAVS